jgi:hypothetical protein
MATVSNSKCARQIVYFETDGRQNLEEVLRVVKKTLKTRPELRACKLVFFTAEGQGPALAFGKFAEFKPRIIAVTFPRSFSVALPNKGEHYSPTISDQVMKFFKGVEIDVVQPPRLPFDRIEGLEAHNQQFGVIAQTIGIFGAGLSLCIQAVLLACDVGLVEEGETVIGMSGDSAGLFTASTTNHFLNKTTGIFLQEIFCKAKNRQSTIAKKEAPKIIEGIIQKSEVP